MKVVLTVSSVFNLALAGYLIFLLEHPHPKAGITAPPATASDHQATPVVAASVPVMVRQMEPRPFRWSQLESADYRTYVRNLRNSGCPELTVRAIVTADVDSTYRHDSEEIEGKLNDLAGGSLTDQLKSYDEQQALKAKLKKMPAEENSEIAYLLGLTPQTVSAATDAGTTLASTPAGTDTAIQVAAASSSSPATTNAANTEVAAVSSPTSGNLNINRWQGSPISYPLVFQKVDLSSLNLNADQVQAVQNLQQSFVNQIGGPNQDPSDPAYGERWQQAQYTADNMLRDILGWAGYSSYQIAARANPQAVAVTP